MTARRTFVALLGVLVALDVLILAIRVSDMLTIGRLYASGIEGPGLYAVWKVRNGYPLYEWPTRPYFALTLYNFLFYDVYAAIFSALRVSNGTMLVAGRLVTLAFAVAGIAAQYAAGRTFGATSFRVPLLLLSIVTWLGCVLPGVWMIGFRPDIPALALSTAAVAIAMRALGTNRPGPLLAAGVLFFLAWGFKQSQVALFASMCVYVLAWRRSLRALVWLAAPFVAGVAISMVVGGAVYRANILDAPTINPLVPYLALYWYRGIALTSLLLWGLAIYAIVALARPGSVHGPLRSIAGVPERSRRVFGADLTYPALAVLVAFALGTVLMAKVGSSINHVLELNVAASLACAAVLGSAWETPRARVVCSAGALMLVPMIAYGATLLGGHDGPLRTALLLKSKVPSLHLTTLVQARQREQIAGIIASLPRPVYSEDEVLGQPWHATGGRYPGIVLDHIFYDQAMALGLLDGGVEGLFADRYFASAVLSESSPRYLCALRAGYRIVRTLPDIDGWRVYVVVRTP